MLACTQHARARTCTAPSSTRLAQPGNSDSSLQALERSEQEVRTKEELVAACKSQIESLAAEKEAAEKDHVAKYNAVATE